MKWGRRTRRRIDVGRIKRESGKRELGRKGGKERERRERGGQVKRGKEN